MKIAAIVPTFNRLSELKKCIASLQGQSHPLSAIIVVDNASIDGTSDYLLTEAGRGGGAQIIQVSLKENKGSAGGFKAGLEEGMRRGFDYFYLMDDDAVAERTAVEELLNSSFFLSDEKALVGSMMYDSASGEVTWELTALSKDGGTYLLGDPGLREEGVRVEGLTYTGMLISREMVEAVGFPFEPLFAWWDDAEYCFRLRENGYSSYVIPSSKISHPRRPTKRRSLFGRWQVLYNPGVEPWRFYYYIRNGIYVFNRHYGGVLWFKSVAGLFLQSLFITLSHKHKWKMVTSTLVGAFDGFTGRLGIRKRPV